MKVEYIFYIIGVIFIFASVWYFAGQFLIQLPNEIKLIILIFSTIGSFIIAELLRGGNL